MLVLTMYNQLYVGAFILCGFTTCFHYEAVKFLKDYLLVNSTYDATIRPVINQYNTTNVTTKMWLMAIHDLDEMRESLTTTVVFRAVWYDEYLMWDPYYFGGVEVLYLPQNLVWKPDLALKNTLQAYTPIGHQSLNVQVLGNGRVYWYPLQVFESTCSIDITYFPNDVQTCHMAITSWSYTKMEVQLVATDGVSLRRYGSNAEWDVIDLSWFIEEEDVLESTIVFEIKLKRKSTYVMLTLIFPIIVLSVLNLFVFALPCSTGEKSGYAVTIFLAFTVFLTILESSFPHNSEKNSYFAILVIYGTVQSTVITIVTLIMIRCSTYGDSTDVPAWLVAFIQFTKCTALRKKLEISSNTTAVTPLKPSNTAAANSANIHPTTPIGASDQDCEQDGTNLHTWQECIDGLDIVFFCFFTTTCLIAITYFFIMIQ